MDQEEFDVIIVGAGTAGCLAAMTTASAGLKVGLIDRKKREEVGEKICGDALGEHHLENVGLKKPSGRELERRIEGVQIYSPDLETVFTIEYKEYVGYVLNRRFFGQWLLKKALDAGATLFDSTLCISPTVKGRGVIGIVAKDQDEDRTIRFKGRVVLDGSGFLGMVRRNLPPEMGIETEVAHRDVESCYREVRQIKEEPDNKKYCEIYLNQEVTPGGYTWIFPKGGARLNAGLGVCMQEGFPDPKHQFYEHVLTKPVFEGSLLLKSGTWYDPTRRPLDNMVGDGVAILGDAACLVNPIHGGGIGPSMLSGYLAGNTVVDALENGEADQESLWPYNQKYMEMYGAKQAGLEVFRNLLLNTEDEDLNYGMKQRLLTEEDILKASLGEEFHLNVTETARRVFRGISRLKFLNRLRNTVNLMNRVQAHYDDYPENPHKFSEWKSKTLNLFQEVRNTLSG